MRSHAWLAEGARIVCGFKTQALQTGPWYLAPAGRRQHISLATMASGSFETSAMICSSLNRSPFIALRRTLLLSGTIRGGHPNFPRVRRPVSGQLSPAGEFIALTGVAAGGGRTLSNNVCGARVVPQSSILLPRVALTHRRAQAAQCSTTSAASERAAARSPAFGCRGALCIMTSSVGDA